MITAPSPPSIALVFWFVADNGRKGEYTLWYREENVRSNKGIERKRVWYWQALGTGGTEGCAEDATEAARFYIRNRKAIRRK